MHGDDLNPCVSARTMAQCSQMHIYVPCVDECMPTAYPVQGQCAMLVDSTQQVYRNRIHRRIQVLMSNIDCAASNRELSETSTVLLTSHERILAIEVSHQTSASMVQYFKCHWGHRAHRVPSMQPHSTMHHALH